MAGCCLLYYITDRLAFPGDEKARRTLLLQKIAEAAAAGIDYIQLREKDLSTRELERLAGEVVSVLRQRGAQSFKIKTQLLINSRTDVALAVGADGVHLRAGDISPQEVREVWKRGGAGVPGHDGSGKGPLISVACHSPEEVARAAKSAATLAVFAPVFEKKDLPANAPAGLAALERACLAKMPVLALGGVSLQNAEACFRAGAAGIAGIRIFQENDIGAIVSALRGLPRPEADLARSSV